MITSTPSPVMSLLPLLFLAAAGLTMIDRWSDEREIATSAIIMYTARRAVIG